MTEEKKIKRSHRLCPCNAMDMEGIQSWLEDLAMEGLLLERDSIFCGFWSFEKTAPRKAQYRLEVIQAKFLEDTDCPGEEMVETAEAMGWEYVTRYGQFYIYRSFDPQARPLHTDPAVQALTVKWLSRRCWTDLLLDMVYVAVIFFLRRSSIGLIFRDTATFGFVYALCFLGLFAGFLLRPATHVYYLRRAIRQLKAMGSLESKRPWKKGAVYWLAGRILPALFLTGVLTGLGVGLIQATDQRPVAEYTGDAPFVSIQALYPEGEITSRTDMGDYNTFTQWNTALSENLQWTESGNITIDGKNYHFILRLHIHETAGELLAKGVFLDYYHEDAHRYHGKRFETEEVPPLDVDALKIYSSYDIRYILLRQGSTVIHATVTVSQGQESNRWQDWLQASVDKLTK